MRVEENKKKEMKEKKDPEKKTWSEGGKREDGGRKMIERRDGMHDDENLSEEGWSGWR